MRLTIACAVIALFIGTGATAQARPKSADDDVLVTALLGHADAVAAILEKHLEHPKKAIAVIDKYLKKRRKPMKATVAKLVVVANELDPDARSDLRSDLLWAAPSVRFMKAMQAFQERWGEDPAYKAKIDARFAELMTDGKKLFSALMQ
jgi:hypothetical protein